jgi:hypothetical protein
MSIDKFYYILHKIQLFLKNNQIFRKCIISKEKLYEYSCVGINSIIYSWYKFKFQSEETKYFFIIRHRL